MRTEHFGYRIDRVTFIRENIGFGEDWGKKLVDKGHPNGAEIHVVTTTGIVKVFNARTKKLVTVLIARPAQLARYGRIPEAIMALAREHQRNGWNEI